MGGRLPISIGEVLDVAIGYSNPFLAEEVHVSLGKLAGWPGFPCGATRGMLLLVLVPYGPH